MAALEAWQSPELRRPPAGAPEKIMNFLKIFLEYWINVGLNFKLIWVYLLNLKDKGFVINYPFKACLVSFENWI